jgi:hypothetical protein
MANKLKASLNGIIDISQQLLSMLQLESDLTSNSDPVFTDHLSVNDQQNQLNEEQLRNLLSERQILISQLFEQYTQVQLSSELTMINEMVRLDKQLLLLSQNNKQYFALQLGKLKKSSKVKELYQKY